MKNRYYADDGEQCGVEQLALQYYAGEGGGWRGVHAESGIWMTIFGLLMWDIIFADIPDVFRTSFQVILLAIISLICCTWPRFGLAQPCTPLLLPLRMHACLSLKKMLEPILGKFPSKARRMSSFSLK